MSGKTKKIIAAVTAAAVLVGGSWGLYEAGIPPDQSIRGQYVSSRFSDKYHLLGCQYVREILPDNRVYFITRESAVRAGKDACKVCKP